MKIFAVFCPVDKVHKSTEDSCLAGHNGGLNKLRVNKKKIKKRVYKPTRQQRPLESARAHEFLNFFYSIIFSETRVGRRRKKTASKRIVRRLSRVGVHCDLCYINSDGNCVWISSSASRLTSYLHPPQYTYHFYRKLLRPGVINKMKTYEKSFNFLYKNLYHNLKLILLFFTWIFCVKYEIL